MLIITIIMVILVHYLLRVKIQYHLNRSAARRRESSSVPLFIRNRREVPNMCARLACCVGYEKTWNIPLVYENSGLSGNWCVCDRHYSAVILGVGSFASLTTYARAVSVGAWSSDIAVKSGALTFICWRARTLANLLSPLLPGSKKIRSGTSVW